MLRLVLTANGDGVELVERDTPAEVDAAALVEPPADGPPGDENLALEGRAALAVAVSSIIWGHDHMKGRQKLRNVLRPGERHGAPRFQHDREDCSFIFAEHDHDQWLLLDLGAVYSLSRVGATGYNDRWLSRFEVTTSLTADLPQGTAYPDEGCFVAAGGDRPRLAGNVVKWGSWSPQSMSYQERRRLITTRPFAFDAEHPVDARYVLFRVASGHYYGAGARLGPLCVWGSPGWWSPETHASFPPAFHDVAALIQLVSRAPVPPGEEEHGFAKLPRHLLRHIFSFLRRSDWPYPAPGAPIAL